ncbi:Uncharacterised protein [Mycobacteroides abscessus subsp. abscessus]|nr:Uncharacterised protein [Mycobacteroides abscessus subsp. abscessus]
MVGVAVEEVGREVQGVGEDLGQGVRDPSSLGKVCRHRGLEVVDLRPGVVGVLVVGELEIRVLLGFDADVVCLEEVVHAIR